MAVDYTQHSYFEQARIWSDESGGMLSPQEVLRVWEAHPDWAPGGKWYGEYGGLPSSQLQRTVELDRELTYMRIDWFGATTVLASLASASFVIWLSYWAVGPVR